jgi:putative nucleotidyltransferase with HDIG domain
VLVAGYFLGRRIGVLTSVFSVLAVVICVLVFPQRFFDGREILKVGVQLSSWGGFLILASITVGTLYERNEKQLRELKNAYVGILEILSKYLESTDRYTKGHSVRVSEWATEIATAMELPRSEVENIRVAGLLHDIGKTEISSEILQKAAQLSTEEKELMDLHTVKGAYILSSVGSVLKEVVPIVVAHHKYFVDTLDSENGEKLKIPLGARVVAVADAFDAMTTDRPYRKGMPPWEALQEIVGKTGKQFDPEVVKAFKHIVSEKIERA